jgi:Mg2+ and Co2+ transporter CorA
MPDTRARGERESSKSHDRIRIRLFDADRTDRILSFDEAMKAKMSDRQLLWIDVEGELQDEARAAIVERFELAATTDRALAEESSQPHIELHGRQFHLAVAAEPDPQHPERAKWFDIVAGPNLVISRHHEPLEFLEAVNGRIARDATIGELDSAEFVASLLDSVVTTYHTAVDGIEDELDEFDARALRRPTTNELFPELVTIRRRVGRLRRLLAAHREVFGSLGRRDFGRGIESADPDVFVPVTGRFDAALVSVESTREVVLASFDVLMTRTAQRTNDVMRVLTLATVLALPAALTAGLLGMNVIVPVPNDNPASFWLILGAILLLELAVLGIARLKGWI